MSNIRVRSRMTGDGTSCNACLPGSQTIVEVRTVIRVDRNETRLCIACRKELLDQLSRHINEDSPIEARYLNHEHVEAVRRAMLGVPRKTSYHRAILRDCDGVLDSEACRESVARAYNKMRGFE